MNSSNEITISGMMLLNNQIYGNVNAMYYGPTDMLPFLGGYGGRLLKAVRTNRTENVRYWLANSTSWLFGLCNKLNLNLEDLAWQRFKGVCPYCRSFPCKGSDKLPCKSMEISSGTDSPWKSPPISFSFFQAMLAQIYHFNTLANCAWHAAEEILELNLEVAHFVKTCDSTRIANISEEASDVLANFCGVATCLGFDLSEAMAAQFAEGCPSCHKNPCCHGYLDSKIV